MRHHLGPSVSGLEATCLIANCQELIGGGLAEELIVNVLVNGVQLRSASFLVGQVDRDGVLITTLSHLGVLCGCFCLRGNGSFF